MIELPGPVALNEPVILPATNPAPYDLHATALDFLPGSSPSPLVNWPICAARILQWPIGSTNSEKLIRDQYV
jgi:hypothetical protein